MTTRVVNRSTGAVFDVYVGRPSFWGNPFSGPTRGLALHAFQAYLMERPYLIRRACDELRGKILGCWCTVDLTGKAPIVCHAQILARVADGVALPILPPLSDAAESLKKLAERLRR